MSPSPISGPGICSGPQSTPKRSCRRGQRHSPGISTGLTSTIALLHLPKDGPFPEELRGTVVVHLSFATPDGASTALPFLSAVRRAAEPAVDTAGPSDAERLSQIHLDPPPGGPTVGDGRWLSAAPADQAISILTAARVGKPDGLTMMEIRHLAAPASPLSGALSSAPASFLYQGLGQAGDETQRSSSLAALTRVRAAARPLDIGQAYASFRTGQRDPDDALTVDNAAHIAQVSSTLDPDGLFKFERVPTSDRGSPRTESAPIRSTVRLIAPSGTGDVD